MFGCPFPGKRLHSALQETIHSRTRLKHEEQLSIKKKKSQKDLQKPFTEHPFSDHVLSLHFTHQISLKKNGDFPLSSQGLLPLETSEQTLLQVKASFKTAHPCLSNVTTLCLLLAYRYILGHCNLQNRSHHDWHKVIGNTRDSTLPMDATCELVTSSVL